MDSIRRADVVLFLIDAPRTVSQVDKHLGATIEEESKPVILVVSKWDKAVGRATTGDFAEYLGKTMPGLAFAPIACVSAQDQKHVLATIDLARNLYKQSATRVSTGDLNRVVENAIKALQTPSPTAQLPKIYFATQVAVCPPTIVLFVNNPDLFNEDYRRFIVGKFREELPFPEVPIRLVLRAHFEEKEKPKKKKRTPLPPA
jgi:GTP-binding protein